MSSCGPNHVETVCRSEYVWIDSAIAGAAAGTFETSMLNASVQTQLGDGVNDSTLVNWKPADGVVSTWNPLGPDDREYPPLSANESTRALRLR